MPILPVTPPVASTTPYDLVNDVLNTARVRLNDALENTYPTSGKLLDNNQFFTLQATNQAWRNLQEFLANQGFTRLRREVVLQSIPPVATMDPATQASLSWIGYFNGVQTLGPESDPPAPLLPSDLIIPLVLWERTSGSTAQFYQPMRLFIDGLPTPPKLACNRCWEWREDAIFMPGSTTAVDIRVRYAAYLPDFVNEDGFGVQWYQQQVPIMRCQSALAWYLVAEVVNGRTDIGIDPQIFISRAESDAKKIYNREAILKQRTNVRRQPRSGRSHSGWDFL